MAKVPASEPAAERRRAAAWWNEIGGALASIFLPAGCRLCEQLLTGASRLPICKECLASFSRIKDAVCDLCGRPLEAMSQPQAECEELGSATSRATSHATSQATGPGLCISCRANPFHFERARSFARYEGSLVRAIILLKFEEMEPLADWFAERLEETVRIYAKEMQADLIVPVPLHKIRRRERGFNQAELLSKRLARRLGIPHQAVLLVRKRPRPDKHLLTSHERWEAVRGAFAARAGSQVDKRRVLLVDDVMTTGATLDACAKALRDAGASSVLGLTIARAILNPQKVSRDG